MKEIVQKDTSVLRKHAAEVPVNEMTSEKVQDVIKAMRETLEAQPDGAALAAPQIGVSLRIFVISERVFGENAGSDHASKDSHFVYINPRLTRLSKKRTVMNEGCLSVRGHYGNVERHVRATVEAYDEHGKKFIRGASDLLAQAFQHEIDHLDGALFIDKAQQMWEPE